MKWQPIYTAPKKSTDPDVSFGPMVILASTNGHRAIGYWSDGYGVRREGWVNPHDHQVMNYWNAFTHWMPLPEPPR